MTPSRFAPADAMMREAVASGVFPGAVLLVSKEGGICFHRAYGSRNVFSKCPMTCDTIFDLASLSKPLATTLAVMHLIGRGKLRLDMSCRHVLPTLTGTDKADITIAQLLGHCSGMPSWRPFFRCLLRHDIGERPAILRQLLAAEPLWAPPGTGALYSDLGFMLLQWVIETAVGMPLERYVMESIFAPLGYTDLVFPQNGVIAADRPVAATELCAWRKRLLIGEVHDDNAHAMGGAGGHAGLFGTARGVHKPLYDLLAADRHAARHPLFEAELIRRFWTRGQQSTWALGFDTPSRCESSAGSHFDKNSVGHLGFTGTSFWVDRKDSVIIVLLTNRVHPSRHNAAIRTFRPVLHDCVRTCLAGGPRSMTETVVMGNF